jgi:hypothetical protein
VFLTSLAIALLALNGAFAEHNGIDWQPWSESLFVPCTGEQDYLDDAIRAAAWIIAHRGLPDGGFRHDAKDPTGPPSKAAVSRGDYHHTQKALSTWAVS